MPEPAAIFPVSRQHLDVLSDGIGIMQHAIGSVPDPAHGYCVDDVARALQVDLLHQREVGWAAVAERAWRNLRFIRDAFDPAEGRFRNFRSVDGAWLPGRASEDSQGRAMLALGETISMSPDPRMVAAAADIFADALPEAVGLSALRAQSSTILGCDAAMRTRPADDTAQAYRLLAGRLRATFANATDAAWPWPERRLTYENALPARALIVAGRYLDEPRMVDRGLRVLDWLIEIQTAPDGHFAPIGNGWWTRDGERSRFDQQPIEATAMILAAEDALAETGDDRDRAAMERAYAWFLGENDLGVTIADPARGAGADGLTPTGINTNEGAESTLMWLMALEHIRALRGGSSSGRSERRGRSAAAHRPSGGATASKGAATNAGSEPHVPVIAA